MKNILKILAVTTVLMASAFANQATILSCSTGGANAFILIVDQYEEALHVSSFFGISYGEYPLVDADNDQLIFFKKPSNINNGIPMTVIIPRTLIGAKLGSPRQIIKVTVSQNYPNSIDVSKGYTYNLSCEREFPMDYSF